MRLSKKIEIQPTPSQLKFLRQSAGTARWTYNWGLAKCLEAYKLWVSLDKPKKWKGWQGSFSLSKEITRLKKLPVSEGGFPWLSEVSAKIPQQALRDLDSAFSSFLKGKAKYPKFKKKGMKDSFRLVQAIRVEENSILLPKLGRMRIKPGQHGYIDPCKPTQATVSCKNGRWYVSVLLPNEFPEPAPYGKDPVGLDLGIAHLATLSDNTVIPNPRILTKGQKKLKRLQQNLSRKKKGSQNRKKAQLKLGRAYDKVLNSRSDYLHKVTTNLTKNHRQIVIEDLKVKNMIRKGGSRKKGLNRSLGEASFGEIRRMLEYKGKLYGCEIKAVPAAYTSQRCSTCKHVDRVNRKTQSKFVCTSCGFEMNADLNAAINILKSA